MLRLALKILVTKSKMERLAQVAMVKAAFAYKLVQIDSTPALVKKCIPLAIAIAKVRHLFLKMSHRLISTSPHRPKKRPQINWRIHKLT